MRIDNEGDGVIDKIERAPTRQVKLKDLSGEVELIDSQGKACNEDNCDISGVKMITYENLKMFVVPEDSEYTVNAQTHTRGDYTITKFAKDDLEPNENLQLKASSVQNLQLVNSKATIKLENNKEEFEVSIDKNSDGKIDLIKKSAKQFNLVAGSFENNLGQLDSASTGGLSDTLDSTGSIPPEYDDMPPASADIPADYDALPDKAPVDMPPSGIATVGQFFKGEGASMIPFFVMLFLIVAAGGWFVYRKYS